MGKYNPKKIEKKWQKKWEEEELYKADDNSKKEKFYCLDMFPYPSAAGLHVGHPEGYTATDIFSRYMRMKGREVMHPMGWDAFGLPAENYAIKTGVHPKKTTGDSIKTFRRQIKSLGFSYDWDREIATSDPEYYKWTQWIFLQLYKNGLAYKKKAAVNWCESCKTVLANEQVINGKCERCKNEVIQKDLKQWFFKTTKYAQRLLDDLDNMDWPEPIKLMQREWIGRSEGSEIDFEVKSDFHFVLLHGFGSNSKSNFFPWLKKELENRGYKVDVPDMPNSDNPTEEEQVNYVLKNIKFSESTILFGHSLGAVVAMKVVEKLPHNITRLVLAGGFTKAKFKDIDRPFKDKFNWDYDYEDIKKKAGFIKILSSLNDHAVPREEGKTLSRELNAELIESETQGSHFNGEKEPIILKNIIPNIKIFTTRADTLYGATYMVLAPEYELIKNLESRIENLEEIYKYKEQAKGKSDLERTELQKEKTGVQIKGVKAINPANEEEIPIYIADYVLSSYGTGAIMAVPAHDERDFEFAKKYNIPIKQVIIPFLKTNFEKDLPREDKETVKRNNVIVIIKHWQEDKYYCLDWVKYGWKSFVIGGVKNGESYEEAAIREMKEESGYQNIKSIKKLGGKIATKFYAMHKGVNRDTILEGYYVELADGEYVEPEEEHVRHHKEEWIEKDKLEKYINLNSHEWYMNILLNGEKVYAGTGNLTNSDEFNSMDSMEAKKKITEKVGGKITTNYKLRDWLISRQRYWGAPIPIIYCDKCGEVPVPEEQLPVKLPEDVDFKPTGESPLKDSKSFHKVKCPKCGASEGVKREVDTMDTFVCSSWYYLRYCDPKNKEKFADNKKLKQWMPVDLYVGGAEHACLHLIYARFFYKALKDLGFIKINSKVDHDEPFQKLKNQGMILGEDHQKMSKSRGNVINPDEVVVEYGADTLRMYEMFMGSFEEVKPWDTQSIKGIRRFLDRVWNLYEENQTPSSKDENLEIKKLLHKTIKKVTEDIESFNFNTAISSMMVLLNKLLENKEITKYTLEKFLLILSPFAPHITEELWEKLGSASVKTSADKNKESIFKEKWPEYNDKLIKEDKVTIIIQINGKFRDKIIAKRGLTDSEIYQMAQKKGKIEKYLEGKKVYKLILVKDRLLNILAEGLNI